MATSCCIAVEHCSGTVSEIYCCSNGSLLCTGAILLHHYATTREAAALTKLGDLVILGESPGSEHTSAYMRDRGTLGATARRHADVAAFKETYQAHEDRHSAGYDYMYLLTRNHGWQVKQYADDWEPLLTAITTEKLGDS